MSSSKRRPLSYGHTPKDTRKRKRTRKSSKMAPTYEVNADRRYSIAVVGGGIGGLCTAIGLLHQGVPVEIYEGRAIRCRHATPELH